MSDTVVKLMSATRAEFERSLAAVSPSARLTADGTARIEAGAGHVLIRVETLPPRRLGGLISMPQVRVEIDLAGMAESERAAFLARFDLAFQRGGG